MVGGAVLAFLHEILNNLHPVFYPFVPYWTIIMTALCVSPLTILLPQLLQRNLSWPLQKDTPDEWIIYGRRYNLKPWYEQHPGGTFPLRATKGSDCTGLFESCHTFIDRNVLLQMLAQFEIKNGIGADQPSMVYDDPFYDDLKKMAREHFRGKGKGAHKMPKWNLYLCLAVLGIYWFLIYHMVTNPANSCITICCIVPVGLLSWCMTGSLMHDASHNALVRRPWLNRILSHAAFPFGVNVTAWHIQHVMSHHIYTNEHEHDVDLHHFEPVITLKSGVGKVHFLLHYLRLAYILSTAIPHLMFVVPYGLLFGQTDPAHGHKQYDYMPSINAHRAELRWEIVGEMTAQMLFWGMCACYQGALGALCVNLSVYVISSYAFSFFTQVSHLQEECFVDAKTKEKLSFAKRQVASSTDFSADSGFWGQISGGLNTQAIHHCFPSISAVHLRAMYPKFRQVCKAHGVELKEAASLVDFVKGFVTFSN
jgi:linoleoyl-CoA desaturase